MDFSRSPCRKSPKVLQNILRKHPLFREVGHEEKKIQVLSILLLGKYIDVTIQSEYFHSFWLGFQPGIEAKKIEPRMCLGIHFCAFTGCPTITTSNNQIPFFIDPDKLVVILMNFSSNFFPGMGNIPMEIGWMC